MELLYVKIKTWNWNLILTAAATITMAVSAGFSAYFAGKLTHLTEMEWNSKKASLTIYPSLVYLYNQGILSSFILNTGLEAALEVRAYQTAFSCDRDGVFPANYINENFFALNSADKATIAGTLSGNSSQSSQERIPYTQEDTDAVRSNIKDIYFVAHSTYRGHEVRLCRKMGPLTDVKTAVDDFRPCPIFNCSDDVCSNQVLKRNPSEQEQRCTPFKRDVQFPKDDLLPASKKAHK